MLEMMVVLVIAALAASLIPPTLAQIGGPPSPGHAFVALIEQTRERAAATARPVTLGIHSNAMRAWLSEGGEFEEAEYPLKEGGWMTQPARLTWSFDAAGGVWGQDEFDVITGTDTIHVAVTALTGEVRIR